MIVHIQVSISLKQSYLFLQYYQKEQCMFIPHKQFSIGELLVSQARTIIIDTEEEQRQTRPLTTIATISKLPAFQPDEKLTKILYSKFLVKGVRPINSDAMFSKLKNSHQKRQRIGSRSKNLNKEISQQVIQQKFVTDLNSSHQKFKVDKQKDDQNGIFQYPKHGPDSKFQKKGRPQTAFQRSQSLSHFNRPLSAAIQHSSSQRRLARPTSVNPSNAKNRSTTAISRTSSIKNKFNNYFQIVQQNENKRAILTIADDCSNIKNVNYIDKNKREASVRKQSAYITDVNIPQNTSPKRPQRQSSPKRLKIKKQDQLQSFVRQTVSAKQKENIKQKHTKYLNYLKEKQPQQYSEYMKYLNFIENKGTSEERSLFSCSLDQEDYFSLSKKQVEDDQVQGFYQNFYNVCIDTEYGIKRVMRRKTEAPENTFTILNIYQCEQLLSCYREVLQLRKMKSDQAAHIRQIKQIIKNLNFFRNLKSDVLKCLFQMKFSIEVVEEDFKIIQQNALVSNVYVILNGSVSKKNQQNENQAEFCIHKAPQFFTTLFDGQVFGLPAKPQQKTLKYTVKTLQKCLLMAFPYEQYRKALSSNQNIEDKIEILRNIVPSTQGNVKLNKEDFEIVAFQVESGTYAAQELIYREGEECFNIIAVAAGRVAICFQSFLTRKKKGDQLSRKRKDQVIPKLQIKDYRRRNLKNYEIIQQNAESITYYYCEIIEERSRGDVLNWQGFRSKLFPPISQGYDQHQLSYSIMALHDNTVIYQLMPEKIQAFPPHIHSAFMNMTENAKDIRTYKRNLKQAVKWQNFKQNLIENIIDQKKSK